MKIFPRVPIVMEIELPVTGATFLASSAQVGPDCPLLREIYRPTPDSSILKLSSARILWLLVNVMLSEGFEVFQISEWASY